MDDTALVIDHYSDYPPLFAQYLAHLKASGRRPATVTTYDSALRSILGTMRSLGPVPAPNLIDGTYLAMLRDGLEVSERSRHFYFTVLGAFLKHITGRDIVGECGLLWNRTVPRRKFIAADDFRVLLANATHKERLVLLLGALCGLRRSEIAHIRLDDICGKVLIVRGKGHGKEGKVAYIRIPEAVLDAIAGYMPIRANILLDGDHSDGNLIVTESPSKRGYPATSSTIGAAIRAVSNRAGVELSPHSLRRLFATSLYDMGVDMNTLRIMMRHEDIRTTMECYIDPNPAKIDSAALALERMLV